MRVLLLIAFERKSDRMQSKEKRDGDEVGLFEAHGVRFCFDVRADIIEAQCALASGRLTRVSELLDDILTSAAATERRLRRARRGPLVRKRSP
jgi:hypothetical protein